MLSLLKINLLIANLLQNFAEKNMDISINQKEYLKFQPKYNYFLFLLVHYMFSHEISPLTYLHQQILNIFYIPLKILVIFCYSIHNPKKHSNYS